MKNKRKTTLWTKLYSVILILFTLFVLLDTFIIPRAYVVVEAEQNISTITSSESSSLGFESTETTETVAASDIVSTENSYSDGNISIKLTNYREYDTDIYVAEVTVSNAAYLETAFAKGTFGKNVTEITSDIAAESNAILAINGDYYGTQNSGYVIRNGVLYRETVSDSEQEDLVIYEDGTFEIIKEGSISASELLDNGAVQVFSFGPGLIEDGQITVTENDEVDKAKTSNPRTAIGQIDELHYVFVVSDGRTDESTGLSLIQLAEFLQNLGVKTAYNLDGGGSSTMVFNGTVINNPTTDGNNIKERSVSDIVCIGYQS